MSLVVLMVEMEQPEGISARKLVIETAKHNVITAYNGGDGLALLRRFPKVDAVIVHEKIRDISFEGMAREVRQIRPDVRIVALSPSHHVPVNGADFVVSSHDPQGLLTLLAKEFQVPTNN